MIGAAVIALTLAASGAGWASPPQDPPAPSGDAPAVQLEEVIVEGRTLREAVDQFVEEIVAPPVGRGPARWNRRVCVGVVNVRGQAAQALIDQVSSVALQAGLDIGEPGCRPNILVLATDDGQELAQALVAREPLLFRPQYSGAARSSEALERFQESAAPVRWWHVSMPVNVDTGEVAVRLDGEEAPSLRVRSASRLAANVRDDLKRVVIILDVSQIGVIPFGALSDYVAMAALAQIDPEADTSAYPTVLNLFADRAAGVEAPEALTDWDRDYLRGLYTAPEGRARATQQERAIAGEILNGSSSTDLE